MTGSKTKGAGIAWFERTDYDRLLALFEDRDQYPPNHDEWLGWAEAAAAKLVIAGEPVVRIKLDPDEFSAWCKRNGLKVDSQARSRFAAERVARIRG